MPLLVVFYLFRPNPRQSKSTTYFLWRAAVPDTQGGTFARRLRSNPLMWLQLLFILLIVLFLSRLSTPWTNLVPLSSRVILVVDRSASMQAEQNFEGAVQQALDAVDSMMGFRITGSSPEVMLIAVDSEPRVVVPFTKDATLLRSALNELKPSDLPDQLDGMRPFFQSLIKAHKARVWIFGDHLPESLRLPGLQYSAPRSKAQKIDNAGVVSFTVRPPDPTRGQSKPLLYARVENFSEQAQQRLLVVEKMALENPDRALATVLEKSILLAAKSGQTIVETLPASRFEADSASLFRFSLKPVPGESADQFATDDVSYTVVEAFRAENVLVATSQEAVDPFLLRAVGAVAGVRIVSLQELRGQSETPVIDLLLGDSSQSVPPGLKVRSRFLLPPAPKKGSRVSRLSLASNDAPLVSDSGVEWDRMKVQITDVAPLAAGEVVLLQSSQGPALTLQGLAKGQPTLHWRFPLSYSSLPLSPGLPVIVGRFIDQYSRKSNVPVPGSLATGGSVRRPSGERYKGALEIRPANSEAKLSAQVVSVASDSKLITAPEQQGFFRLYSSQLEQGEPVAVNLFSPSESSLPRTIDDLSLESPGEDGPAEPETGQVQYREVSTPLLLMAFLILLIEAALLLRRGRP